MIKTHYQKYIPNAQSWGAVETSIENTKPVTFSVTFSTSDKLKTSRRKKALISQGLKSGAGDGDRTHDLMLGKHTL